MLDSRLRAAVTRPTEKSLVFYPVSVTSGRKSDAATARPPPLAGRPGNRAPRRGFLRAAGAAVLGALAEASAQPGATGDMALIAAAERGDTAAIRKLLAEGAGVNARDGQGRTALLAATQRNRIEAARVLIEAGADVNAKDGLQDSPFLYAGAEGRLEILKLTLAHGADLKSTNRYGGTALIPAGHHGHVETVRELLRTAIAVE